MSCSGCSRTMTDNPHYRRLAYADPPYPGQAARWYDCAEIDHAELIGRLEGYDGWALSTSAPALRDVLALCPDEVRVAIWHIPDSEPPGNRGRWWWSWEPVIIRGGQPTSTMRDVLTCFKVNSQARARIIAGQKPAAFCRWVLDLLGYVDGDQLDDLYPGSGVMSREAAQGRLQGV